MNIDGARRALKLLYDTPTWRLAVDKMSNKRVVSLYFSTVRQAKVRSKRGFQTLIDTQILRTASEIIAAKAPEKLKKSRPIPYKVEQLSFLPPPTENP